MQYPRDLLFDIDTLINVAQPSSILLLGDAPSGLLDSYLQQRELLGRPCKVTEVDPVSVDELFELQQRFDVAVVIGLLEHLERQVGGRVLSRLRDVLCAQFCVALPLAGPLESDGWHRNELFAFALKMVAEYPGVQANLALFNYNVAAYKNTPDWFNADNWANPEMWGKYRW